MHNVTLLNINIWTEVTNKFSFFAQASILEE